MGQVDITQFPIKNGDITAAFASAVNAARVSGASVYIPAGNWKATAPPPSTTATPVPRTALSSRGVPIVGAGSSVTSITLQETVQGPVPTDVSIHLLDANIVSGLTLNGNAAQQPANLISIGLRSWGFGTVRISDVVSVNHKGLFMGVGETFQIQVGKASDVVVDSVVVGSTDGARCSTGIDIEDTTNWKVANSYAFNLAGQGFASWCSSNGGYASSHAIHCGHGLNYEAGPTGADNLTVNGVTAASCVAGFVLNGNNGQSIGHVSGSGFSALNCGTGVWCVGLPSKDVTISNVTTSGTTGSPVKLATGWSPVVHLSGSLH